MFRCFLMNIIIVFHSLWCTQCLWVIEMMEEAILIVINIIDFRFRLGPSEKPQPQNKQEESKSDGGWRPTAKSFKEFLSNSTAKCNLSLFRDGENDD